MVAAAAHEPSLTTSLVRELLAEIRRLRQQPGAERPVQLPTAAASLHFLIFWDVVVEDISIGAVPMMGGNG